MIENNQNKIENKKDEQINQKTFFVGAIVLFIVIYLLIGSYLASDLYEVLFSHGGTIGVIYFILTWPKILIFAI